MVCCYFGRVGGAGEIAVAARASDTPEEAPPLPFPLFLLEAAFSADPGIVSSGILAALLLTDSFSRETCAKGFVIVCIVCILEWSSAVFGKAV